MSKLVPATSLKKGSYMVIDGVACKVSSTQTSKPGKHGHAKCRIEAIGLIDGQKRIKIYPGHEKIEVPLIEKEVAQVLSVHGDTANVMDIKTYETFDLKIPEELKDKLKEGGQIGYWKILNDKVIQEVR
jgi:translation initiation factor 5A